MSRKNRSPKHTLSQQEADRLIKVVKNTVEKFFLMPAAGEQNNEFHVESDGGERFTIAVYQGTRNASRHQMSARISRGGTPLLRLCVNSSPHTNPDGTRVGGTHWHIYTEGFDDWVAFPADLESDGFVDDTIALLDKFNVIEKPVFQESLI